MITTWSPFSIWGVKLTLCFPRKMAATWLVKRPKTMSLASTIHHLRLISFTVDN